MPTPNWGLPILTGTEAMSFKGLYNAQSNALETGMDNLSKIAGVPRVPTAAARNTMFPSPAQGNRVYRSDLGWDEGYYTTYNATTNPGGSTPSGWYPTGVGPSVVVQRSALTVANSVTVPSLDGGAILSNSPLVSFNASGGIIVVGQPGEYEVQIATVQSAVNGNGQRTVGIGTTGTVLQGVNSHTYLAMGSINNGAYYGRFNVRITAANQTITPNFLQNSSVSLAFSTQVSVIYLGPNKG